jgi:GT2 family glycosyltransferase
MRPQFSILVVVYNKKWDSAPTLKALECFSSQAKSRTQLIIHDNSRVSGLMEGIQTTRGFSSITLLHDGINHPLGNVYRQFVRVADGQYLIFLDDDTVVTEAYVNEVEDALSSPEGSERVCVPQIFDAKGQLYSPSKFGIFSGRLIDNIAPGAHLNLNAIMSGVATSRSYLLKLGPKAFSINTRLYGVDTMFMLAHNQSGGGVWVSRSSFQHSFSHDQRRTIRESFFRSWLEVIGIFWTVIFYRRIWVPVLPIYIFYFMCARIGRAVRETL